jgi:hypothetical protein
MKKEFIPYELALELKQLGFDEPCLAWYQDYTLRVDVNANQSIKFHEHLGRFKGCFLAPLYQQAFRWFRDVHNLKGGIEYIGGLTPETTWWDIYVVGHFNTNYKEMSMNYQPYEEAELACLQKLIEIIKEKK